MALNMRNPLIKRPVMMAGIEGGAIFVLTLLASEPIGKVLQLSLIAAGIAAVAGFMIGAFEKSTVNPSKIQAPTKRERAKKKKEEKEDKPAASTPAPAASTPADASKAKSWAERAIESAEAAPKPSAAQPAAPGPALPTVTTSADMPVSAPTQSMMPSATPSVGEAPPSVPDLPMAEPAAPGASATPPPQPMGPQESTAPAEGSDDASQAAALLSQLVSDTPSTESPPAATPSPPADQPAASQSPPGTTPLAADDDVALSAAIIHPDEELRSHIRAQLREAAFKIVVEKEEFQAGLVALLEQQPDLIVTAAPPLAEDYFQNVRRACQYGVIVLYGDEDPAGIDQITGVWRPWTPLNVDELRSALGLPS